MALFPYTLLEKKKEKQADSRPPQISTWNNYKISVYKSSQSYFMQTFHPMCLFLKTVSKVPSFKELFSSVQSLSHVQLFVTPWTAACQASQSIISSQGLSKLMSIQSELSRRHTSRPSKRSRLNSTKSCRTQLLPGSPTKMVIEQHVLRNIKSCHARWIPSPLKQLSCSLLRPTPPTRSRFPKHKEIQRWPCCYSHQSHLQSSISYRPHLQSSEEKEPQLPQRRVFFVCLVFKSRTLQFSLSTEQKV